MRNVLINGATERVRTVDLYLGKVPLYQLSYSRFGSEIVAGSKGPAKMIDAQAPASPSAGAQQKLTHLSAFRCQVWLRITGHAAFR